MYYSTTKNLSSKNQKKNCRGPSLTLGKGDLCRGHGANGPRQRKLKKNTPASAFPSPLSAPSRRFSSLLRTVPTPPSAAAAPAPGEVTAAKHRVRLCSPRAGTSS